MFGTIRIPRASVAAARVAVLGLLALAPGLAQVSNTYQFVSLSPQPVTNGGYTPVNLANYTPGNQTLVGPIRLALDAAGDVYFTESNDVRMITPQGLVVPVAGFIGATFAADGDGGPALLAGLNNPFGIAIDSAGNIWVEDSGDGALRRISPGGVIDTAGQYTAYGLAVDVHGNVYVPAAALYKIAPDGTVTQYPNTSGGTIGAELFGLAADPSGNVYAANSRYHLLLKITPGGQVTTVAGTGVSGTTGDGGPAASAGLGGAVAPGMIAAIYGYRLGPDAGVSATVDSSGTIARNLAGVQVFFGGIAAPVLYAQSGQINVVAPFEIAGMTTMQVSTEYNGLRSNVNTLPVLPVFPGLFAVSYGEAAAINQDGTINSSSNPAPTGSVVAVFANGGGLTGPVETDGTLVRFRRGGRFQQGRQA
jgi:uncharacterized protein (TIGR03437 family)